ncbi:MKL/myocardin-like protein 1 [Collichthys lucidus]|uniref:MKL/myocardin-like protein 1 n=1 Tax=Collichthys lucidus TaxID=240159 RepID=A0A4U5VSN7_COLLU|nr:MKL/myocardin-like protein 1 [Collichthys lucidus]
METKFGERPNADASISSPQSEAVANELQELSLQPAPNLLPVRDRKNVLQLKLQQRRSREELVNQGIMPPLKSSAAFHEQRRSLERARTEDYLKRKMKSRPERSELIRMHILEETSAEPSLQAKQLQLKRARLADDLNDKISHRPGPMELIHKNILPVHSSIKQAIIETQFPKASGDNSSCDEDSSYSLSPEQSVSQESPLGLLPLPSPPETLTRSSIPSPTQVPPPAPPLPSPVSASSPSLKLTNGTAAPSAQRTGAISQIKFQPKPNSDRSAQRHKKPKDTKPKIKKLKYHQYIPPDQKGDKEPPPHLDSSYAKILQQQQLFLQLQILNQQQQHYNYHAILPAPPKPQTDQQPSSSSSSNSTTTSSPPRPVTAPSTAPSNQGGHSRQSSAPLGGTKPTSLPPNLDEMKVAELKSELKLRSLPVSGTKNDLIERLRTYQELNGGSDTTFSPTAGGTTGPGAEGKSSKTAATSTNKGTSQQQFHFQCLQTPSADADSSATPGAVAPQQLLCDGNISPLTPSEHSPGAMSPEDTGFNSEALGEMMSSPLTQLSLQPCLAAQLPVHIKEEPECSTPAPCQFSLKAAALQKRCLASSAAPTSTTTAPAVVALDKDKMLQEKDKQIEELTRMLMQKQRLVEVLRMQLEQGHPSFPPPVSCELDVTKVSETCLNQQSAPSFPLDLLKSTSAPTLVTDSNGNHFLIALSSHVTENQRSDAPDGKATNQIPLQRQQSTPAKLPGHNLVQLPRADTQTKQSAHVGFLKQQKTKNGGLHVSADQPQQEVSQCLSAPPSLQPFFKDQESAPSGKNTLSPSSQIDLCPGLDVLFSPLSPASIKTAASSPDNKEHEDDFIDIILQTGEMPTTFKPAPDPSLDRLNTKSFTSSPPPSPFQLLLSPPVPPSCDTPQLAASVQSELQTFVDNAEEKQHLGNAGSGRLEDFLESTTGKPLLGVEPGGLLTLIDDLHSQMLCTPSILDHPPSPMDTFDMEVEGGHGLDSMDWLDLTMGGVRGEETPTLAPLGPPTPTSVFSTDFLDSYDLQILQDSCL